MSETSSQPGLEIGAEQANPVDAESKPIPPQQAIDDEGSAASTECKEANAAQPEAMLAGMGGAADIAGRIEDLLDLIVTPGIPWHPTLAELRERVAAST